SRVRVHTGCFLELTTIEDDVFLGPHVVFTDDPHPMCPAYLDCVRGGVVRKGARIGANSAILPGVEIGADALVGAGSVVRTKVPPRGVWAGNPAIELKDEITKLACFAGIFPHAYSWLEKQDVKASAPKMRVAPPWGCSNGSGTRSTSGCARSMTGSSTGRCTARPRAGG